MLNVLFHVLVTIVPFGMLAALLVILHTENTVESVPCESCRRSFGVPRSELARIRRGKGLVCSTCIPEGITPNLRGTSLHDVYRSI